MPGTDPTQLSDYAANTWQTLRRHDKAESLSTIMSNVANSIPNAAVGKIDCNDAFVTYTVVTLKG